MRVLAIDPSSTAPGIAYFDNNKALRCKTYKLKGTNIIDRVGNFTLKLQEILITYLPDYIAIETPYLGISKSTSMKMGQIFGMFCECFFVNGFDSSKIIEIHPMTAKKAVGVAFFRNRTEGKRNVVDAVTKLYPNLTIDDDNAADALAIGSAALKEIYERCNANEIS